MRKEQQIRLICVVLFVGISLAPSGSTISLICSEGISHVAGFDESIVLITGFEPFDIYEVNPSQLIAESLHNQTIGDVRIVGLVLPVNYSTAGVIVADAIDPAQRVGAGNELGVRVVAV